MEGICKVTRFNEAHVSSFKGYDRVGFIESPLDSMFNEFYHSLGLVIK
ncbi:hypothetical protein Lser_V15G05259 [Lactuca serriola]